MQNSYRKIIKYLREQLLKLDLKVYFICVAISSFIWLMMILGDGYNERIEFPITYSKCPKGMILINNPVKLISVDVKAKGFNLATSALLQRGNISLDLSKLTLKQTKDKRYRAVVSTGLFRYQIINQLDVDDVGIDFKPDSIVFLFDSLITKIVPINLESSVTYSEGYIQYDKPLISPDKVKITGPSVDVNLIKYISTDSLILKNVSYNINKDLNLVIPGNNITINSKKVNVSLKTEKYSEFSIDLPIKIVGNVKNLKVKTFPDKVKLTFSMALSEYKQLVDTSFVVTAKLDSIDLLRESRLILKIEKAPVNVKNVKINTESVEYVILHK